MGKRGGSRPGDWHLWTAVKRTVTPLRAVDAVLEDDAPPLPLPDRKPPPVFDKGAKWLGPALPPYVPASGRRALPGDPIEPRMKRRLMRGQIEIDGTIDLHGMRQAEAHAALRRFVEARVARGDRTILVITGKGLKKTEDMRVLDRGVLRAMLPLWLSEPALAPVIAGWAMASQEHGGQGAFYVRLRRAVR